MPMSCRRRCMITTSIRFASDGIAALSVIGIAMTIRRRSIAPAALLSDGSAATATPSS